MTIFSRIMKSGRAQQGATQGFTTSANIIPTSGTASTGNSKGTSKTSAEVIPFLQHAFEEFDADENVGSNFKSLRIRLGERVAKYSNVGFSPVIGRDWIASFEVKKLMQIAAECSVDVYGSSDSKPHIDDITLSQIQHIPASLNAITKQTKIFSAHANSQIQEKKIDPLLIIAVRGTVKSSLDWTVNLNIETTNAKDFLDMASDAGQEQSRDIQVHKGFLTGAKTLLPVILKQLEKSRGTPYKHVLFTGHSGGGAVASLLFMNILYKAKISYPDFRFSLITFGAPPILSRDLTAQLQSVSENLPCPGVALAVVNEHDPFPRMDSSYVKSILDLYDRGTGSLTGVVAPSEEAWSLPAPDLYAIGDLMVLKDASLEDDDDDDSVHAYKTTPEILAQRIFCDFQVHKKATYLQRVHRWSNQGHVTLTEAIGEASSNV